MEWNATYVANSSKFEPDHPEMTTIEVMNLLDNQNKDTTETSQPYETKPATQHIERVPQESLLLLHFCFLSVFVKLI